MAYVRDQQQDEQQQPVENPLQQQPAPMESTQGAQPQQPFQMATSAPVAAGTAAPAPTTTTQQQPQQSSPRRTGGVTNFGRTLAANVPQARGLAETLGGEYVNRNVEQLRQQQQESLDRLETQVGEAAPDYGVFTQGLEDPQGVLYDPNQYNQFRSVYTGEYTGPTELSETELADYNRMFETIADDTNVFEDESQLRQQLEQLDERYSPGRTSFDLALLQAESGAADILRGYDEQLAQVAQQERDQFEQSVASTVESGQTAARETGERAQREAETRLSDFQQSIVDRAMDLQNQGIEEQQAFDLALAAERDLTPEQLAELGVTQEEYDVLRGDRYLQLQNYLTPLDQMNTIIDPQTAATMDEYEYYQALNELIQRDPTFLTDRGLVDTADPDFIDYMTDEARTGRQALEIQRLGIPNEPVFVRRAEIDNTEPGDARWAENVEAQYDRFTREYNIAPDAQWALKRTEDKNQMIRDGYIEIAQLDIGGRRDRSIFVRPGPSGSLLPTNTVDSLYDRRTGETINPGNIPLPLLQQYLSEEAQRNPSPGNTIELPDGTIIDLEGLDDIIGNLEFTF